MDKEIAKKTIILYILKMLYKCSSPEKPITQAQIVHILNDVGVPCERRTVGRNIKYMQEIGVPIVKVNRKGFFYDKSNDNFFN